MNYFDEINNLVLIHFVDLQEPIDIERIPANNIKILIGSANGSWINYSLYFEEYVSYNVIHALYYESDFFDQNSNSTQNLFCIHTKSLYLDYIKRETFAEAYHAEDNLTLRHYQLNCIDHVVNIASFKEPLITRIAPI